MQYLLYCIVQLSHVLSYTVTMIEKPKVKPLIYDKFRLNLLLMFLNVSMCILSTKGYMKSANHPHKNNLQYFKKGQLEYNCLTIQRDLSRHYISTTKQQLLPFVSNLSLSLTLHCHSAPLSFNKFDSATVQTQYSTLKMVRVILLRAVHLHQVRT